MSKIKLIVEIEKRTYELLKDKPDNIAESIIANGIPYNPTGDAISREALKDITYINKGNFNTVEGIREWIDNAQAAEPEYVYLAKVTFDENKLKELTDDIVERIKNGEIVLKDERTNEWTWKPISENWPVIKGYYLTTTIHHDVYCDFWNGENFERTEDVIAWMNLPNPYESKSEAENEMGKSTD